MKPLKLILSGFITYRNRIEVDFERFESGLFIISGPTGSGKSTIFDAISYALYGKVSSTRRSASNDTELRCQYLNEHDPETFVDFTFLASDTIWRVVRKPAQRLQSTVKLRDFSAEAKLYRYHQGSWESVSEKISEIKNQIESAVGLTHEQFTKIVLLPQGEFTAFLSSDTKSKGEILRRIFGTQSIKNFSEKVQSEASEIVRKSQIVSDKIDEALQYISDDLLEASLDYIVDGSVDPVHYSAFATSLIKSLKEKQQALKPLQNALTDSNKLLSQSRIERDQAIRNNALLINFQKSESDLFALKKQIPEMRSIKEGLVEIKKWDEASGLREKKIDTEDVLSSRQDQVRDAQAFLKEIEAKLMDLKPAFEGLPAAKIQLQKDREDLISLKDRHKESLQLQTEIINLEKMKSDFERIKIGVLQFEQLQAERNAILKDLGNPGDQLNRLYDLYDQVHVVTTDLDRRQAFLFQFNEVTASINQRHQSNLQIQEAIQVKENKGLQIEAEKKLLDQEVEKQGLTAFRHLLHENHPCPLCGSIDHPYPIEEKDPQVKLQQVQLEKELQNLERQITSYKAMMKSNDQEMRKEKASLGQLEPQLKENLGISEIHANLVTSHPDLLFASDFWDKRTNTANYADQINQCQALQRAYEMLLEDVTKRGQAYRAQEKEFRKLQKESQEVQSQLEQQRVEMEKLATGISMKTEEIAKKPGFEQDIHELETKIQDLSQMISKTDQGIQEIERAFSEASISHAGAESGFIMAQKMLKEAQSAFDLANKRWISYLQAEGISDQAFVDLGQILEPFRGKEEVLHRFDNKLAALQGAYESQKKMAEGLQMTDIQALDDQIQVLENKWKSMNDQYINARERLGQDQQQVETIQRAVYSFSALLKKRNMLSNFDRVLRGQGGLTKGLEKLDFETYVLIYYFEAMLQYANVRLYKMTDGQYQLVRKEELGRQGKQGLDIDVIDIYTGKQRSSATLSGGESFLASLALALGLSDELTSRSGGRAIETLFIDEGFGTLDSETLQKATEVLLDLTENNRLIGIISHVEDLVDIIPNRIDVIYEKDKGSHIKITRG